MGASDSDTDSAVGLKCEIRIGEDTLHLINVN